MYFDDITRQLDACLQQISADEDARQRAIRRVELLSEHSCSIWLAILAGRPRPLAGRSGGELARAMKEKQKIDELIARCRQLHAERSSDARSA